PLAPALPWHYPGIILDLPWYADARCIFGDWFWRPKLIAMPLRMELKRREFLKTGAGAAAAWLALPALSGAAPASAKTHAREGAYRTSWYPFTGHPDADTCWSLSVGPDGRIYAAACAEGVPGGVVEPVRYNEQRDDLDYLFALGEKVDDPGNSGRATQCKIHYSFAPSMSDGILYMATHLSGPPIDLPSYSPWYS